MTIWAYCRKSVIWVSIDDGEALGMSDEKFWLIPIGLFLDLWACQKQFLGMEKPVREQSIDDMVPV